jgi:1-acyl-sn-glycerol-3-phosphate acyltransferase
MVRVTFPLDDFEPPSPAFLRRSLALQYRYFSPRFEGAENVSPARPALFVGNHAIFGVVDSPLFVTELYRHTGVYPRSLGDHFHFRTPGWGKLLLKYGAVPGTRENCRALMQSGQFVLVFPGGAREVAKRRGEQHRLVWKQRTGFARMAIEHGYDILPFASVGCDVSYDILFDGNDFKQSWWGKRLLANDTINRTLRGGDLFMPVARGLGPTALPRPEPFWFKVGEPIATAHLQGREGDETVLWELREQVADSINGMIADLSQRRDQALEELPRWHRWLLKR